MKEMSDENRKRKRERKEKKRGGKRWRKEEGKGKRKKGEEVWLGNKQVLVVLPRQARHTLVSLFFLFSFLPFRTNNRQQHPHDMMG